MNPFLEVIAMFNEHRPDLAAAFEMNDDFKDAVAHPEMGLNWIRRILSNRSIIERSFAPSDPRWNHICHDKGTYNPWNSVDSPGFREKLSRAVSDSIPR